jgi:hypothetical protein
MELIYAPVGYNSLNEISKGYVYDINTLTTYNFYF